jgi:cytochrome c biogenesis protein CcmG/thiol:disulfide interchange protein DsbE
MLNRNLIPLCVFCLIVSLLWFGLSLKPKDIPSSLIGKPVPHFVLSSLASEPTIVSEKIFSDHMTILHVWATWCSVCQNDHELLFKLKNLDLFQLVGINYKDNQNKAELWLHERGNPYAFSIMDDRGQLSLDLGVYGTPTTYIIDRAGIIRFRHVGALTEEKWNKEIYPQIASMLLN